MRRGYKNFYIRPSFIIKSLLQTKNILSIYIPAIFMVGYLVYIFLCFWYHPATSDGLQYSYSLRGHYQHYLLLAKYSFRFCHFYIIRLFNLIISSPVEAARLSSFFIHAGIVFLSYKIANKMAGWRAGTAVTILVIFFSPMLTFATQALTDPTMMLFAMISFYLLIGLGGSSSWKLMIFFSGFSFMWCLFSKEIGVAFLPVFLYMVLEKGKGKGLLNFLAGAFAGLLIVSIFDWIYLKDFFFHLDPLKFFGSYLNLIINSESAEIVRITTKDIFWALFGRDTLVFGLAWVFLFFAKSGLARNKLIKIWLFGLSPLVLHMLMTTLKVGVISFPTRLYYIVIPFAIAMGCYFGESAVEKKAATLSIKNKTFFCILLFFLLCVVVAISFGFRNIFNTTLSPQVIQGVRIFSPFLLMFAIGMFILCRNKMFEINNRGDIKKSSFVFYCTFIIILAYHAFWGNAKALENTSSLKRELSKRTPLVQMLKKQKDFAYTWRIKNDHVYRLFAAYNLISNKQERDLHNPEYQKTPDEVFDPTGGILATNKKQILVTDYCWDKMTLLGQEYGFNPGQLFEFQEEYYGNVYFYRIEYNRDR
ncbi:hypothetical protein LCGC14_0699960 [marine sediment metagenome]|uniref:Uncharacterized protein n=1 Tax=marine sediment metagenome TaxID=412755 RepID=A0A0F9TQS4_9ZZZZ